MDALSRDIKYLVFIPTGTDEFDGIDALDRQHKSSGASGIKYHYVIPRYNDPAALVGRSLEVPGIAYPDVPEINRYAIVVGVVTERISTMSLKQRSQCHKLELLFAERFPGLIVRYG